MSKYLNDVLFVYGNGRTEKLKSENQNFGREFFYGYDYLVSLGLNIEILEQTKINSYKFTKQILKYFDNILCRITKLTFAMASLLDLENIKKLYYSKNIITSNHGLGSSILFPVLIFKLFKRINFIVIVSGLFNLQKTNSIVNLFRTFVFSIYLKTVNSIIFTNRSEYEFALKKFNKFSEKFVCIPFCIDTNFWSNVETYNPEENDYVMFIGNNGHRKFKLITEIATLLPDINFVFITNQIQQSDILSNNVKLIRGDWNASYLSDSQIRDYYIKARLVILPINNTIVSSGQSVGLQAAALGIPLLISKTKGFWDYKNYVDMKNVLLIDSEDVTFWADKLESFFYDFKLLREISSNSNKLINDKYKLENFDIELAKLLIK